MHLEMFLDLQKKLALCNQTPEVDSTTMIRIICER